MKVMEDFTSFTTEEQITILELARVALTDASIFDAIAIDLDLSDNYLKLLQEKIIQKTN